MRHNPQRARRAERERLARPDLGRNSAIQQRDGNVQRGPVETMTLDVQKDFEVFDRLPKAVRDCLNHAVGKYAAIEAKQAWDKVRPMGWTPATLARELKRLDAESFPQEYSR